MVHLTAVDFRHIAGEVDSAGSKTGPRVQVNGAFFGGRRPRSVGGVAQRGTGIEFSDLLAVYYCTSVKYK